MTGTNVKYVIDVFTGDMDGAGTDADVHITLRSRGGSTGRMKLDNKFHDDFERGRKDTFKVKAVDIGDITSIQVEHDNGGINPDWFLEKVIITNRSSGQVWTFPCNKWLTRDKRCLTFGLEQNTCHHWGYTAENGPDRWSEMAPAARGYHQSPVNIQPSVTEYYQYDALHLEYIPGNSRALVNTGHTAQVNIDGENSTLLGGPFPHRYQVAQFHFHWGRENQGGSEHQVDGRQYAAELHIVHWNTDLYSSVTEAMSSSNGLAVIAVFIELGAEHLEMNKLRALLPRVPYAEDKVDIIGGFDPAALLPENKNYWTYSGSLTTPPCHESVRFLIFQNPIQMSERQLNAFRQLHSHPHADDQRSSCDEFGGMILQNYRPLQPLFDRKIVSSFNPIVQIARGGRSGYFRGPEP